MSGRAKYVKFNVEENVGEPPFIKADGTINPLSTFLLETIPVDPTTGLEYLGSTSAGAYHNYFKSSDAVELTGIWDAPVEDLSWVSGERKVIDTLNDIYPNNFKYMASQKEYDGVYSPIFQSGGSYYYEQGRFTVDDDYTFGADDYQGINLPGSFINQNIGDPEVFTYTAIYSRNSGENFSGSYGFDDVDYDNGRMEGSLPLRYYGFANPDKIAVGTRKQFITNVEFVLDTRQTTISGETYDAVFYVANGGSNGGLRSDKLNNPTHPYSSISIAWLNARQHFLDTGEKTYVHVKAGNYTDRNVTAQDGVDIFYEDGAVHYNTPFSGGTLINAGSFNSTNEFRILGKGVFHKLRTFGGGSRYVCPFVFYAANRVNHIEAKEISHIQEQWRTLAEPTVDANFVRNYYVDRVIFDLFTDREQSAMADNPLELRFHNTEWPFSYGQNVFGNGIGPAYGLNTTFINNTFINVADYQGYNLLDRNGNTLISYANTIRHYQFDNTGLTAQQTLDSFDVQSVAKPMVACFHFKPITDRGATNYLRDTVTVLENCTYIIERESTGAILINDVANDIGYGKISINGGRVIDRTVNKDTYAVSASLRNNYTAEKLYHEDLDEYDTAVKSLYRTLFLPIKNIDEYKSYVETADNVNVSGLTDAVPPATNFGSVSTPYAYKKLNLLIGTTAGTPEVFVRQIGSTLTTRGGRIAVDTAISIDVFTDRNGDFELSTSDKANTIVTVVSID